MIIANPLLTNSMHALGWCLPSWSRHPPPTLQFRDDELDEISEAGGRHHVDEIEAFDVGFLRPSLQFT
jgi:hypothetical protein